MAASAHLRKNPVFQRLPEAALEQLLGESLLKQYDRGERLLSDGDVAEHLFALEHGRVRVFHTSPEGDEVVIKVFHAPAIFGEAEALAGIPFVENVDALEPSSALLMPIEAVLRLLAAYPACAVALLIDVATRLAIASQNQKSLAFDPATVRLANYLVDYASWFNPPGAPELTIDLTQDDMAAAIGVTRRAVASDVTAWQKDGILERRKGRYLLRDPAALRRYATPHQLGIHYSLERRIAFLEKRVAVRSEGAPRRPR